MRMFNPNYYKWWVVASCTIISMCSSGIFVYGFTAFFNPIAEDFQWSYALVSLAYSFRGFETGIAAPIVGIACDKFGPKRILFWGIIVTGLGYTLVAATQNLWSYYLIFIFLSIGMSLCSLVATMTLVSRWFTEKSSMAMGILTTGVGMGGLLTPLISALIDSYGWRQTAIMIGIVFLVICIPLVLTMKNPPNSYNLSKESEQISKHINKNDNVMLKQVVENKVFLMLALAIMFASIAGMAVTVHQMPHLINIGIPRQSAAFAVSVFAVANIAGRLLFGAIGDTFDKRKCAAIAVSFKIFGILALGLSNNIYLAIFSATMLGIGFGGLHPLRPGLQIQLFGMQKFGSLQGLVTTFAMIGSIISPLFAGWMFDLWGDYRLAFVILGAITAITIPLVLSLPKERQVL